MRQNGSADPLSAEKWGGTNCRSTDNDSICKTGELMRLVSLTKDQCPPSAKWKLFNTGKKYSISVDTNLNLGRPVLMTVKENQIRSSLIKFIKESCVSEHYMWSNQASTNCPDLSPTYLNLANFWEQLFVSPQCVCSSFQELLTSLKLKKKHLNFGFRVEVSSTWEFLS